MSLATPDSIDGELVWIRDQMSSLANSLYDAEVEHAKAVLEADKEEHAVFLNAQGTVADRNAIAKFKTAELRLDADLKRAAVTRIKTHLEILKHRQMNAQSRARMVEMQYRSAGQGER